MELESLYQIYLANPHVVIDSREVQPNSIFFGFKGSNVDGNKFAHDALDKRAALAVIDNSEVWAQLPNRYKDKTFFAENTLHALQGLAEHHRNQLDIPIIALTGSNGKTTTKELLQRVLSQQFNAFATPGNFNNHIGLPLSILQISYSHEIAVLEFGANHLGEHSKLCRLAKPDYGLITNIGKDHLEGYGGWEGVIQAHKEFTDFLYRRKAHFFLNNDDETIKSIAKPLSTFTYGKTTHNSLDCAGYINALFPFLSITVEKNLSNRGSSFQIDTHLFGDFHFYNLMAAVCTGQYFGISNSQIKEALASYVPANNRSEVIEKGTNKIILDAYNANPSSMQKALENFDKLDAKHKIAILGDMFELGKYSEQEHATIVNMLKNRNYKIVLVGNEFGKFKNQINGLHFPDFQATKTWFEKNKPSNTWVLIKGSRGMELEKIVK